MYLLCVLGTPGGPEEGPEHLRDHLFITLSLSARHVLEVESILWKEEGAPDGGPK